MPPTPKPESVQRRGLSLGFKLSAVVSALILVVVVTLTALFHSKQIEDLNSRLATKAERYALLLAAQARSAVAFNDRETARELFEALARDTDLEAIALFSQNRTLLHSHGALSPLGSEASVGVESVRVFRLQDRVLCVAPVVSLEGPRGTLVIELSKRSLVSATREITRTAALSGVGALVVGMLLSWLFATSVSRRVGSVAGAARKAAEGDLEQPPLKEGTSDEIGVLAWSFNQMLQQLRELIRENADRAASEQLRLEALVAERTLALRQRNRDLERLLDSTAQGFFTVELDGRVSKEHSAVVVEWLGAIPQDRLAWQLIGQRAPDVGNTFEFGWQQVVEGILPLDLALSQMPRKLRIDGLSFSIDYRPISNAASELESVLVVISDVTAEVERDHAEQEKREVVAMFSHALDDRLGIVEFLNEAQALLSALTAAETVELPTFRYAIHTLKGSASQYGLESIATTCHAIEAHFEEGTQVPTKLVEGLAEQWTRMTKKLKRLLGEPQPDELRLSKEEYADVLEAIRHREPHSRLEQRVSSWRGEPTHLRLRRLAEQAKTIARRLNKPHIEVVFESNGVRIESARLVKFWNAANHAVRNCIDHGLESSSERERAGKTDCARLTLRTELIDGRFVVEIADNGRGLDWDKLRLVARSRGLPSSAHKDLIAALLTDGVTTTPRASLISGRGVGVGALVDAVSETGGELNLISTPGNGTRYEISWAEELLAWDAVANDDAGSFAGAFSKVRIAN